MATRQVERYRARKAILVEEAGGRCVTCGSTEGLEFDHVNPATKTACVTQLLGNMTKARAEAAKCRLVCHRCHLDRTTGQAILRQAAYVAAQDQTLPS